MASPNGDDDVARQRPDDHRHHHQWTTFEFDIMLALICKGVHHKGIVEFSTQFNEGLNGAGYGRQGHDIDMEEIQEILVYILDKKKAAVTFVERQTIPRVTRTQKRAFMRNIDFTGTKKEWVVEGRKKVEAVEHPRRVRRMLERKQKAQFLRDFERGVEEQGQQRGHQRLSDAFGETSPREATRHGESASTVSDDFRYTVHQNSYTAQSIMPGSVTSHHIQDGVANALGSRAPTYPPRNGSQHQQSTSVAPMPGRSANLPSEVDNHDRGAYIHEVQAGLGTDSCLLDVPQSLLTPANPTLDTTSSGAHVKDPFRPVEEDGPRYRPYHKSAVQNDRWSGQGAFAGDHITTTPNGQSTSEGIPGSKGSRQPRSEMTGRCTPLQGLSPGRGRIGGLSTAVTWQGWEDRQSASTMPDRNLNLATPFADLQAQPYHENGSSRNSREVVLAPGDGRAPQPNVGHGGALRPRDLDY